MAKSVDELWINRRRASYRILFAVIVLAFTLGFWSGFGLRQYQESVGMDIQERRYMQIVEAVGSCGNEFTNARTWRKK